MTLSLDDVRNKRFRMARKSGYEVLEVDEFVDEVEDVRPALRGEPESQEASGLAEVRSTGPGGCYSAAGPDSAAARPAPAAAAAPQASGGPSW